MRYLKYTQVDSVTAIPVTIEPARNGPVPPAVTGLAFGFALESQYPTLTPIYYGTAPDASDIDIPGVLDELTEAEYQAAHDAEIEARADKLVPKSCTPAQGLMALYALKGITEDDILAAINSIEDPTLRYQAQIAYKKANIWERVSMSMQVVAQLMALTKPDLDELFTLAATYTNL